MKPIIAFDEAKDYSPQTVEANVNFDLNLVLYQPLKNILEKRPGVEQILWTGRYCFVFYIAKLIDRQSVLTDFELQIEYFFAAIDSNQ